MICKGLGSISWGEKGDEGGVLEVAGLRGFGGKKRWHFLAHSGTLIDAKVAHFGRFWH